MNTLASSKLLPIFKELLGDEAYKAKMENERYDFLRTKEVFKRSMDIAHEKYGWTRKNL